MPAKLLRKMAILVAIETVVGTAVVPLAANAVLASDVTLTPLEGDSVERNNIRPFFGSSGSTLVTEYQKIAFSVEFAGVAIAGDMPGVTTLLRACAISATNQANTKTVFAPVTDGIESVTIYANVDGTLYKMHGARGEVEFTTDAKAIPKWKFEFSGSFVPAVDQVMPAVNYSTFLAPLGVNKANTTLSLDGVAVAASAFSWKCGNQVTKRDLMNVDTVEITDRKSTGSVTFENTSVATKNWIAMARASAVVPLVLKHGQAATNTVIFKSTRAQIGKPTFADSDGVQMITIPLSFIPSDAGNDEWSIEI
ncbi:hypothetical protein [Paracidovorax cattleyae]|uniref:hypothetical protein n=1 Tax=Paracidovorax cattleyae TaxID=80868 RepID=UPI0018AFE83F|nr:hypothetical protein [Paracidovorax cattleyae]MBF9263394.1 hypothetical protein [Paracidovorax cattleyae]